MIPQTPFARVLERVGRHDLVEVFNGRANRTTIANWKAGRHPPPQWAIDRLRQLADEFVGDMQADLDKLKPGPGLKAGARNLAAYLAVRRS